MLIRDVEKFLRETATPATRFGRETIGDPALVFQMRNGRIPRPKTEERIRNFMQFAA